MNEAFLLQVVVGPFGGNHADAQLLGQQPNAGQGLARFQLAGKDLFLNLAGDLGINRALTSVADVDLHLFRLSRLYCSRSI